MFAKPSSMQSLVTSGSTSNSTALLRALSLLGVLGSLGLAACSSATPDGGDTQAASGGLVAGVGVSPPQPPAAPPLDDAGSDHPCVQIIFCIFGTHWDHEACACVPDDGGVTSNGDACAPQACGDGESWDASVCACVTNEDAGSCSGGEQH